MSLLRKKPHLFILVLLFFINGITCVTGMETKDKYGETIEIEDPIFQRKADIAREFSTLDSRVIHPDNYYSIEPENQGTLTSGTIKESILEDTMDYLMFIRYVAGLTNAVSLEESWSLEAQKAALVNFANRSLSHSPIDPGTITQADYEMGYEAASKSNLALYTYLTLENSLDQYMLDESPYNKFVLGHRRWLINPFMDMVGFGFRHGTDDYETPRIGAVKVFDDSGYINLYDGRASQPERVLWPSEQAFPLEFMKVNIPWSISLDPTLYNNKKTELIEVRVTNTTTGESQHFNPSSLGSHGGGNFNINTDYMSVPFCIIFIPDIFQYREREVYDIQVDGLFYKTNEKTSLTYSTEFFRVGEFDSKRRDSNFYYAESLRHDGLFKGSQVGYELDRVPTRIEGLVMFIRMLGEEEKALAMTYSQSVFTDIPGWANGYAAYAYEQGYIKGMGNNLFGSNLSLSANDYTTFILRALGYCENDSFHWSTALRDFQHHDFIDDSICTYINSHGFTRGDMAALTYYSRN